ncbi:MAG: hypothetical protein HY763_12150 [Planctomycetes bacterium]|nr:hypothetical protein [Planctomycetota bacterium]
MTRTSQTIVIVTALGAPILPSAVGAAEPRRVDDAHFATVEYGRSQLKDQPDATAVLIPFARLDARLRAQMYNTLAFILTEDAHPQGADNTDQPRMPIVVRVRAARDPDDDDVIEYEWTYNDQTIRAIASRNAVRIDIGLAELDRNPRFSAYPPASTARARALVESLMQLRGANAYEPGFDVRLPWPDVLRDGVQFSSNPELNLHRLTRLHERVDVFVKGGVLSLQFYKKPAQLMQFQDGSQWFAPEFRAAIWEDSAKD